MPQIACRYALNVKVEVKNNNAKSNVNRVSILPHVFDEVCRSMIRLEKYG